MSEEKIYDIMKAINVKQVILQGPPGTSKTHGAKELIASVVGNNCTIDGLDKYRLVPEHYNGKEIQETVYWDMVQFHPSYSYEDFIRGISVSTDDNSGQINYKTVNKIFGDICKIASKEKNKEKVFFLIIDEINRADVATVFGELIYALEYRGKNNKISTPYSVSNDRDIYVPENLYIIGTMNTADKSVGTIDMAIRRRFLFVDQLPKADVISSCFAKIIDSVKMEQKKDWENLKGKTVGCFNKLKEIMGAIRGNYKAKDFMIGHTYFLPNGEDVAKAEECIKFKLKYQVLPMLREYAEDRIIDVDKINGFENLKKYLKGKDDVLDDAINDIMP